MGVREQLVSDVSGIVTATWDIRTGQVVPTTSTVKLQGGAVRLEAAVLYADLADSTQLAMKHHKQTSAKVYKSFLHCASKLIREQGGKIRSFDGDRVMGIFVGPSKCSDAALCALKINYAVQQVIQPKILGASEALRKEGFVLKHAVGVDAGEMLVVRGGVRNDNDLVWVGRAPNVAAKLCGERAGTYRSYITQTVFSKLNEAVKYDGQARSAMWEKKDWSKVDGVPVLYRSKFSRPI